MDEVVGVGLFVTFFAQWFGMWFIIKCIDKSIAPNSVQGFFKTPPAKQSKLYSKISLVKFPLTHLEISKLIQPLPLPVCYCTFQFVQGC